MSLSHVARCQGNDCPLCVSCQRKTASRSPIQLVPEARYRHGHGSECRNYIAPETAKEERK